jgi:hypothetical protein
MAAAAALSVAAGVVVLLTVENLQGEPRLLAFAAVSLLAVVVLTWMIFWMRRQAPKIKGELHVYALGYQELTGESADLIEILNLDERASNVRELVDSDLLGDIRGKIRSAGDALRANDLPRHPTWCNACDRCDLVGLCRQWPRASRTTA